MTESVLTTGRGALQAQYREREREQILKIVLRDKPSQSAVLLWRRAHVPCPPTSKSLTNREREREREEKGEQLHRGGSALFLGRAMKRLVPTQNLDFAFRIVLCSHSLLRKQKSILYVCLYICIHIHTVFAFGVLFAIQLFNNTPGLAFKNGARSARGQKTTFLQCFAGFRRGTVIAKGVQNIQRRL